MLLKFMAQRASDSQHGSLGGKLSVRGCLNHAEQWGMPQSPSLLMATAVRTGDVKGGAG